MRAKLEEVLGQCKFVQNCICLNKSSFEYLTLPEFCIHDVGIDTSPVQIVSPDNNFQLKIFNNNQKGIWVVKLDKCLLPDNASKCDCLIIDNNKLYFVEIKSSSSGTRKNKRRKAIEQLGATISYLTQAGIDFANYKVFAVVCFKSIEPRITNSANNSARAAFLEKYNVNLEEKNVLEL